MPRQTGTDAASHAYEICQLTNGRSGHAHQLHRLSNGRADLPAEVWIKRDHLHRLRSFNAYIKRRTHQTKKSQLGRRKKKSPEPAQQKRDSGLTHHIKR
jgi:hypothetical protein